MKMIKATLAILACSSAVLSAGTAFADPDRDESGKRHRYYSERSDDRRWHRGEGKEEYWDGNCKVERKWKKNGEYKEERRCRAPEVVISLPPVVIGF
ncbi:MAG: hypothetical protein ACT4P4_24080 [Betaproteobacteria bacterium]